MAAHLAHGVGAGGWWQRTMWIPRSYGSESFTIGQSQGKKSSFVQSQPRSKLMTIKYTLKYKVHETELLAFVKNRSSLLLSVPG